jgi:restriction endonuclease S subunit
MNEIKESELGDVCTIFRGRGIPGIRNNVEQVENLKPVNVIGIKDISETGIISLSGIIEDVDCNLNHRFLLKEGDVLLFYANHLRCGVITAELAKHELIAKSMFLIIRPNFDFVKGEVVSAFFNSILGKKCLNDFFDGRPTPHLTATHLRHVLIPIPTYEEQEKIASLYYLNAQAYQAALDVAEQQRTLGNAKILSLLYSKHEKNKRC